MLRWALPVLFLCQACGTRTIRVRATQLLAVPSVTPTVASGDPAPQPAQVTPAPLSEPDQPPLSDVQISGTPLWGSTLHCSAEVMGSAPVQFRWEKEVSGSFAPIADATQADWTFQAPHARIRCAAALAGGSSWVASDALNAQNLPPGVPTAVSLSPSSATRATTLRCQATAPASDPEGDLLQVEYRWRRNGVLVPLLSTSEYALAQAAVGDAVICEARTSDSFDASAWVAAAAVSVANRPPLAAVSLLPTSPTLGSTLACDSSTSRDPDGDAITSAVVWLRGGIAIPGASASTLAASGLAIGDAVSCRVGIRDSHGVETFANSAAVTLVNRPPSAPVVTLSPNPATKASTLVCNRSGGSDPDGDSVSFTYDWLLNGVSLSMDVSTLSNTHFSKGDEVACRVSAEDTRGATTITTTSALTVQDAPPAIASVVLTTPDDPPVASSVLTCTPSSSDVDGDAVSHVFSWKKNDSVIVGQQGSTLNVGSLSVSAGDRFACEVRADAGGLSSTRLSNVLVLNNRAPTVNSVTLSVQGGGSAYVSSTLTCAATASDPDGGSPTLAYEWKVDGVTVSGVSGTTLTPAHFSNGQSVVCAATATDGAGASHTLASAPTAIVNRVPVAAAVVSPAGAHRGTVLHCAGDGSSDPDSDSLSFSYSWKVGGTPLGGQALSSLPADTVANGASVVCVVTADDGFGGTDSADSDPLVISNRVPLAFSATTDGPKPVGATVTCSGTTTDPDTDSLAYQTAWEFSSDNVTFSTLVGETSITYVPLLAQGHGYLRCQRTAVDSFGGTRSAVSGSFQIPNSAPTPPTAVSLTPAVLYRSGTASCSPTGGGVDPDGDAASSLFVWKKGGVVIAGQTSSTLSGQFASGDSLTCEVAFGDGSLVSSFVASSPVVVLNTAPTIPATVTLTPAQPSTPAGSVTCTAAGATDEDGDTLSYEYRFQKNGVTEVDWSASDTLSLAGWIHGDHLRCAARAKDPSTAIGPARMAQVYVVDAPTLSTLSPTTGAAAGGYILTLTGTNFISGMTVTVGGSACTGVTVASSTSASCTVPAGSVGGKTVVVTNVQGSASLTNGLNAVAPTLSITAPTSATSYTGPEAQITFSGTCTPGLGSLTVAPGGRGSVVDGNCLDGTWSATVSNEFSFDEITVSATDAASDPASDSLTLARTVILGQSGPNQFHQNRIIAGRVWTNGTNRFAVADYDRHRVLLWNSIPANNDAPPDVVLGASAWDQTGVAGCGTNSFYLPHAILFDGTHLLVADRYNNRVLIWNSWPSVQGQPADVVLGQANQTNCTSNRGSSVAGDTLADPLGLWSDGSRLLVADASNNRVLYWPTFPTTNGQAATWALGQPDLVSGASGVTQTNLSYPIDVTSDGTRVFVGEYSNARVLVFAGFPAGHGESAANVLGQPNFTSGTEHGEGVTGRSLGRVSSLAYGNNLLAVSDGSANRVLVWNVGGALSNFQVADVILGQSSATSRVPNAPNGLPSASNMFFPRFASFGGGKLYIDEYQTRIGVFDASTLVTGMSAEKFYTRTATEGVPHLSQSALQTVQAAIRVGTKLIVSDYANNRVFIWNDVSKIAPEHPDVVLGQPTDFDNVANNGGLSARSLSGPIGLASDGTRLFVADFSNSRILIWNTIPTASFANADAVLGQADFTSVVTACDGSHTWGPHGIALSGNRLFVTELPVNRVTVWDDVSSISNGMAASRVIGQASATSCNAGASTMYWPAGVTYDGTHLAVADYSNRRVLIWNGLPASGTTVPDFVLGQPDFATVDTPVTFTDSTLYSPHGVASDGTRLFVSDPGINRILVFNWASITANNVAAFRVLGHSDFSTTAIESANYPLQLSVNGGQLYSGSANQVLWWDSLPSENGAPPHGTIESTRGNNPWGHVSLTNLDGSKLRSSSVVIIGGKVVAADYVNNRVLIWNSIPTTHGAAADVVLGQSDFVSSQPNKGGLGSRSLYSPMSVATDGTRLIVGDVGNGRVLIWNSVPTVNFAPADVVLCKPDFVTNLSVGGPSASTCNPTSVQSDGTRLFVAAFYENRVLIWNSMPTASAAAAHVVVGQPTMTSARQNQGGSYGTNTMRWPAAMASDGTRLAVTEYGGRVRLWNSIPTVSNVASDVILGQPDHSSNTLNSGGLSASSLNDAGSSLFVTGLFYLADRANGRVLRWDAVPAADFSSADSVWGQSTFASADAPVPDLSHQYFPDGLAYDAATGAFIVASSPWNRVLLMPKP